jgi:hypothetical protein
MFVLQVVPVKLSNPTDQEVIVEVTPALSRLRMLGSTTLVFGAGELGPQEVTMLVPVDGRTRGVVMTSLELKASSINEGYDGLTNSTRVQISEIRSPGLLVTPNELRFENGQTGQFSVQLTEEPSAPITIRFVEARGGLSFLPAEVVVEPSLQATNPHVISVISSNPGISGRLPVTAVVSSELDTAYDGLENDDLEVVVIDPRPPEILVSKRVDSTQEGQLVEYQLALATAPSDNVTVSTSTAWLEGLPKHMEASFNVTFNAGEAFVWKRVSFVVPYNQTFLGDALLGITHVASSSDPLYSTGQPNAATPVEVISEPEILSGQTFCDSRVLLTYTYIQIKSNIYLAVVRASTCVILKPLSYSISRVFTEFSPFGCILQGASQRGRCRRDWCLFEELPECGRV